MDPHEDEYHQDMVKLLEILWGEGFLSPGGSGNVKNLVGDLDLAGKRVLDIGCGLGGPAMMLAEEYGARVAGIDLEQPLVDEANRRAACRGLDGSAEFRVVEVGPLPFADESFDLVMSCGAFTQTEDKAGMFAECHRVLAPGGSLSCYEWMKSDGPYSQDMEYFFKMEGLTYAMATLEQHGELLRGAGFEQVVLTDASDWYRREARREYDRLRGELSATVVDKIGSEQAAYFVENWRALVVVCESCEMLQGYCRARKPG